MAMSDDNQRSLQHDVAFDLLSNRRRRFVLRRLQREPEGIELGDLATELAASENDVPAEELSTQDRKRIYVSLYQTHIPKLEDNGVVTYDAETGMVRPTDRLDDLAAYFEAESETVDWEPLYLLVGLVGLALYGSAYAFDLPLIEPVPVGFAVLIAIVVVNVGHYLYTERFDGGPPSIAVGAE